MSLSRNTYIAEAISAASFLGRNCDDMLQLEGIVQRAKHMVTMAWMGEWRFIQESVEPEHQMKRGQVFWQAVIHEVRHTHVVEVTFDERNNPSGVTGRVDLRWQPENSVTWHLMRING